MEDKNLDWFIEAAQAKDSSVKSYDGTPVVKDKTESHYDTEMKRLLLKKEGDKFVTCDV